MNPLVQAVIDKNHLERARLAKTFTIQVAESAHEVKVLPATAKQIHDIQKESKTLVEVMVNTVVLRSLRPDGSRYFSDLDNDFIMAHFPPRLIAEWWSHILRPLGTDEKEWKDEMEKAFCVDLFEACGLPTL